MQCWAQVAPQVGRGEKICLAVANVSLDHGDREFATLRSMNAEDIADRSYSPSSFSVMKSIIVAKIPNPSGLVSWLAHCFCRATEAQSGKPVHCSVDFAEERSVTCARCGTCE